MTDDVADGWHSPEDRKLMVRAVARMSDACEAPDLTPECPFFEFTTDGQPVCAEQCQDLIARYPGDLVTSDRVGLGVGLAATRRRPRRGPAPDEMAYDASQVRLEDLGRDLQDWRFGSLLLVARERAYSPAGEHLNDEVPTSALIGEIARRGIDPHLVVPLGLARDRVNAVGVGLLLSRDGHADAVRAAISLDVDGWMRLLREFGGVADGDRPYFNARGRKALLGWLQSGDAERALSDVRPSVADLEAGLRFEAAEMLVLDAQWMIERFTATYLADWSSTSLTREWRFIKAQRAGCCPPGLMRERRIDPVALSGALADEHCSREENADEAEQSWTPTHFKSMAVRRLREGRPEAAAEVLRVLNQLQPGDAEVHNDLGFCLLPSDPKAAVPEIRLSLELGSKTPALTALNLGLALHLVQQNDEAVAVVMTVLSEGAGTNEPPCYVWAVGEGELEFRLVDDLMSYGEQLVDHMASCNGGCLLANLLD